MSTASRAIPLENTTSNLVEPPVETLNRSSQQGLNDSSAKRLAKGLGWLSINLRLVDLLSPPAVAWLCDVSNKRTGLIRLYGLCVLVIARQHLQLGQTFVCPGVMCGGRGDRSGKHGAAPSENTRHGRVAFAP